MTMRTPEQQGWDERYRASGLVWGAGPNRFLVDEVTELRPGTALDPACGEGRNAIWLASIGWQVVGVDFSAVGLDKARQLASQRDVRMDWVRADLTTWEQPSTYDLVEVMYLHLPEDLRHNVLARMGKSVAPGGTMLVVAHDLTNLTEGFGGPQDPTVRNGPDDVVGDIGGFGMSTSARFEDTGAAGCRSRRSARSLIPNNILRSITRLPGSMK